LHDRSILIATKKAPTLPLAGCAPVNFILTNEPNGNVRLVSVTYGGATESEFKINWPVEATDVVYKKSLAGSSSV
jgi:hypothetical protein